MYNTHMKENKMYNVIWKDTDGVVCDKEFDTLNLAMAWAKTSDYFVTIKGGEFEIVGKFGVDSVENGLTPDGVAYTWNKASRIGRVKRERS